MYGTTEATRSEAPHDAGSILIVDDDPDLRRLVADALREHGFSPSTASDGARAIDALRSRPPALVILDLGLPECSGLDVLRRIREIGDLPVIIVTGRSGEADRVLGLELGADDYVVKPFSARELVARVKTVLRRSNAFTTSVSSTDAVSLAFDGLTIDLRSRDVIVDERSVDLTAREFDLLAFLAASPRQVFSRTQLLQRVWNSDPEWQNPATVAEHVHRLRRKVEPDPAAPRWIQTMRGAGYRFTP